MLGVGLNFLVQLFRIGLVVLVLAVVVWLVTQALSWVIQLIFPSVMETWKDNLATMRSWLPKFPKRKRKIVKKEIK